ncbi:MULTISPECIES: SH3 domain-containing protein [unclassified Lysobacter]|uniref:SH3 domain-containing protein n=1 Tax=unclassified Lysobacter TaxID=2635362 RepID=UPI0006F369A2|nr:MULTISPECIES: SH3 domain-containing protein [unclassified Lysobacter]KQZ56429.1 hypothetical protein ASD53_12845 [Lysobacter sp. Root559]KRC35135.1 hypothetical protein ASE10_10735 [Lysobacter sp. Root76]KRD70823.1 hypothetical protein ASE45_02900 [Lysobacter sp. Root96]
MRRARVVVGHRVPDRSPIRIERGQRVTLGDRDRDWPQFVWTVLAEGQGGWVPAALFDSEHGPATALSDYDTRELAAAADEVLTLHYELAQWWWAENARGEQGWIPARALEYIDEPSP